MKKNKILIIGLIACIIPVIFAVSIVITTIDTYFFIPRKEAKYVSYLESRYNQKAIIKSKVEDIYNIDYLDYDEVEGKSLEAYICSIEKHPDIEFVVGYGKFKPKGWEVFSHTRYFDNYDDVITGYLRDKYFETIEINDNFSIHNAVDKIENTIKQWENDAINYGITPTPFASKLKFNIVYYGELIENVEIWNTNNIHGILVENISK